MIESKYIAEPGCRPEPLCTGIIHKWNPVCSKSVEANVGQGMMRRFVIIDDHSSTLQEFDELESTHVSLV
jgi:hypothetical protein